MNPEYCLANLPDENSSNSQGNILNPEADLGLLQHSRWSTL